MSKIIGVAVKFKDIVVALPKPNRHCDCFTHAHSVLGIDRLVSRTGGVNQGFYTEQGEYLDRTEAFKTAEQLRSNYTLRRKQRRFV